MDTMNLEDDPLAIQLQAEIIHLKELLEQKQAEFDRYTKFVGNNNCGRLCEAFAGISLAKAAYENDKLPSEILDHIFKFCDDKLLLNYRLVCKTWKLAFDDSSKQMGRFTFDIYDWRTFNESTIVDKVKSVRIYKPWKIDVNNKCWLEFCNRLGQSVRKITFDFCNQSPSESLNGKEEFIRRSVFIITSLLTSCTVTGLNELHILNAGILDSLVAQADIPVESCRIVRALFVVMFIDENPNTLKKILAFFPNLSKIQLTKCNYKNSLEEFEQPGAVAIQNATNTFLCEFVKENNGSLKEFKLDGFFGTPQTENWMRFLFTSAEHGIKLTLKEFKLDVSKLILYEATPEAPVNEKACQCFENASLCIDRDIIPVMETRRLGYCTNLKSLAIKFYRIAQLQELFFFEKLTKLVTLDLNMPGELQDEDFETVLCPGQAFDCGIPSLSELKIGGDIFGRFPQVFWPFFLYFPNLKKIDFNGLIIIPKDFIVHLSLVKALEEIEFGPNRVQGSLKDELFTKLCKSQRPGEIYMVPAIAAFCRLKTLIVQDTLELTDVCVVEGIALSKTLSVVFFMDTLTRSLTAVSVLAMTNANFVYGGNNEFVRSI